jgi:hypothetical protein
MNKQPTYLNSILNNKGGKPEDWEKLLKSINSKQDE